MASVCDAQAGQGERARVHRGALQSKPAPLDLGLPQPERVRAGPCRLGGGSETQGRDHLTF
jgi:hypothetical protein